LTTPNEYIQTRPVKEWKKEQLNIQKRPAIFIFYAGKTFR